MGVVSDVYTYLVDEGLAGGSTEWALTHRRKMTDVATGVGDQLVVLTEDGGASPEIAESAGIGDSALMDPQVLVTVRAGAWDGDASFDQAQAIHDALHGQRNITVGSKTYLRVRALTPEPVFSGFDDKGRPEHTISFALLSAQ